MMRPEYVLLLLMAGCQVTPGTQAHPGTPPVPARRWILVERLYEEVEPWIQNAGDAEIDAAHTTLVFEPVEADGDERLRLVLQASRCLHRLRCSGDIPDRQVVGEPVEVTLAIDCHPQDVHRVDVIPTRSGVRLVGIRGATAELPNLSGFYVRGSAKVSLKFTADSQGLGGIKAILSEVGSEGGPRAAPR